jgi:hypothetical protein
MYISPHVLWTFLRKPAWLDAMMRASAYWDWDIAIQSGASSSILTRREDGAHPCGSPFYFEWWYFDIFLPSGAVLTVIFHLTDLIKPAAKTGSLNVSFFRPDQPTWMQFTRYPRHEIIASSAKCDVRMDRNRCWIDPNDVYHILIDEPQIKAEITFNSLVPGWRPGNGTIRFGNPRCFFSWVVPQPRAEVTGYIQLQSTRWEIEGIGYHDHNWGTVSLIEALNAWSWGRVYMDDYTLVYADMHLSPRYTPSRPMPFLLACREQLLISSSLDENVALAPQLDFLFAPSRVQSPGGWNLSWQRASEWFNVTLRTKYVLEKTDLIQGHHPLIKKVIAGLVAQPYYVRCVAEIEGEFAFRGRTAHISKGQAICEQIVLRTPTGLS